jgi:hypothetical protein
MMRRRERGFDGLVLVLGESARFFGRPWPITGRVSARLRSLQIDLSDENATKLRDALAPYVGAARKAGGRARGRVARQTAEADKPARSNRDHTAATRYWARANGHQVSDRGRISKSVMDAYRAAN